MTGQSRRTAWQGGLGWVMECSRWEGVLGNRTNAGLGSRRLRLKLTDDGKGHGEEASGQSASFRQKQRENALGRTEVPQACAAG